MILLHRLTPFAAGLVSFAGFLLVLALSFHPLWTLGAAWLVVFLLLARLAGWKGFSFLFWSLVGVPALFLLSAYGLFLFLEMPAERWVLAIVAPLLVFLFAEHLFSYTHTPALYQAYAI